MPRFRSSIAGSAGPSHMSRPSVMTLGPSHGVFGGQSHSKTGNIDVAPFYTASKPILQQFTPRQFAGRLLVHIATAIDGRT